MTLRIPSWASMSSKPRLTSSNPMVRDTSGATSISPASQRSTSWGTCSRPLTPPNEDPATRRPVINKRGTMSSVSPLPGDAGDRAQPPAHARRLDRLSHYVHVAGGLERVVGAEAARHVEHPLDRVLTTHH